MKIAIYNMHFAVLGGGERRSATLAEHLALRHDVTIIAETSVSSAEIKRVFGIDLSKVRIIADPSWGKSAEPGEKFDVFINNSHGSTLVNRSPLGIYMCMFPEGPRPDLSSYQIVTANSKYTGAWIRQVWGYDADVIYSACPDMSPPKSKEKVIISVGRFFADSPLAHHKNQKVLLETFIGMVENGLQGWELQLIGNQGQQPQDGQYVDALRAAASRYPVRIETGVEFGAVRDRLRRAAIYWHATGYGSDPLLQPSRQEHFGMSIVEAMSAAAIPIAFNSGGPREIIRHGLDGFLWSDPSELKAFTLRLAGRRGLFERFSARGKMSRQTVKRSKNFNVAAFLRRMDGIIEANSAPRLLGN